MHHTRVAVVTNASINDLEAQINDRLERLEADRHNVEILTIRVQVVGDEGLTEAGNRLMALILYRDFGSAADADANEQRSKDAFDTMYRDSVH